MKIIFSRKGFDSSMGNRGSPIIDDRPRSLPIPTGSYPSETTYADLGLTEFVEVASKRRYSGTSFCHHDPMFEGGQCAFGQVAAAQTHLANQEVGCGDVFLFFGTFAVWRPQERRYDRDRHHRIFGYLKVDEVIKLGSHPVANDRLRGFPVRLRHPHTLGEWESNNTLYLGPGQTAETAHDKLRLSHHGGPRSCWRIPPWLHEVGLTYHEKPERWIGTDTLDVVRQGQEFVSNVANREDARLWLEDLLSTLRGCAADG